MEYIDLYDNLGEYLHKCEEKAIVHAEDLIHKAVHVWILNNKNELLLQRRSPNKELCPNMLDVSFAGHISAGETSVQAVLREGKEELGISVMTENLEYLFSYRDHRSFNNGAYFENEIADVFLYRTDVEIEECVFADGEVVEIKYLHFTEIEKMWKSASSDLVPHNEQFTLLFYLLHQRLDS